ncbi:MAG TPA: glycosyltransferase family 4 protein [Bacteroidales bacterium]
MKIVVIGGAANRNVMIEGGVESVVKNLTLGFENFPEHQLILLGNQIVPEQIGNISYQKIPLVFPRIGINLNFLFFRNKIINKIEKGFQPDIYHFQGTIPNLLLINKTIQKKVVVTQHGILREELKYQVGLKSKIKFQIKIFLESSFIKKIRNMIFISDYNKKYMLAGFPFLKRINSALIYNPVNPLFSVQTNTKTQENRMYFVGEIKKRKGLHDLLDAIKESHQSGIDYVLDVIGGFKELEYEQEIKKLISEDEFLQQNVFFHGWKLPEEIVEIAGNSRYFVLPSYQETLPVSLAEAMALGKVVIATSLPGIMEMVEDGKEGKLFQKGNTGELVQILKYFSENPLYADKFSVQAKQKAAKMFSETAIAEKTINFYKKILIENQT